MCKKEYAEKVDRAVFPGVQAGPLMHVIAAKAVSFKEAAETKFKEYQWQIVANAKALAETLIKEGFRLVSGGTDNHLTLVDVGKMGISGRQAADLLEESGIVVNKNLIPYDKSRPSECSGIRPGTPALTTRGMKEPEMEIIAKMISRVLKSPEDALIRSHVRQEVRELCQGFPIYQDLEMWQ